VARATAAAFVATKAAARARAAVLHDALGSSPRDHLPPSPNLLYDTPGLRDDTADQAALATPLYCGGCCPFSWAEGCGVSIAWQASLSQIECTLAIIQMRKSLREFPPHIPQVPKAEDTGRLEEVGTRSHERACQAPDWGLDYHSGDRRDLASDAGAASDRDLAGLGDPVDLKSWPRGGGPDVWKMDYGLEKLRDVLWGHREMRMIIALGEWYKVTLVAMMMR